jgi:hypothetical protein
MSHTDDDLLHNPDVAHEQRDVNVRALLTFAVGLVVIVTVIFFVVGGIFNFLAKRAAADDPTISPLARPATQMPRTTTGNPYFGTAPGPQLLTAEPAALGRLRATEDERLQTYGWVDEKSAIARVPISEAKKLILQRGLPARAEDADPSAGTRAAAYGESSGGRTIPNERNTEEHGK